MLLDYLMPEMNGGQVAAAMKRIKPDVRIVFFSAASVPEAEREYADGFVEKGQPPLAVLTKIEELLREPTE